MRTGRPRIRTLAEERAAETVWMREFRAKRKLVKRPVPPEVISRRKSRAGQVSAKMIAAGVYRLPVPGWRS